MRTNIAKGVSGYYISVYNKNGITIKIFKFNKIGKYIRDIYSTKPRRWQFKAKNLTKEEIIYADLMFKLGIDPS